MKTTLIAAAFAGLAMLGAAGPASAWTRDTTIVTPRGVWDRTVTGGCAYGTCGRGVTTTGPYGGTVTRYGTVTRVAPGVGVYHGTTVGPRGGIVTRHGTVTWGPYRPY